MYSTHLCSFTGLAVMVVLAGCASASDPPLGGPYGGTAGGTTTSANPTDPAPADAGSSGSSGSSGSRGSSGTSGSSGSSGTVTPTWTSIWTGYFAKGTAGNCAKSGCHSQMGTATGGYSWLAGKGYITATKAPLADPAQSCLSWLGGNMPPSGATSNAAASSALVAWAAAGAPNN